MKDAYEGNGSLDLRGPPFPDPHLIRNPVSYATMDQKLLSTSSLTCVTHGETNRKKVFVSDTLQVNAECCSLPCLDGKEQENPPTYLQDSRCTLTRREPPMANELYLWRGRPGGEERCRAIDLHSIDNGSQHRAFYFKIVGRLVSGERNRGARPDNLDEVGLSIHYLQTPLSRRWKPSESSVVSPNSLYSCECWPCFFDVGDW
ncbi:hypothetical protein SLEP1_g52737 [Rubroshorea leprosula]|uniref:Uncharacterized protein n=1 Tax=Rubroshorea leprosula TaxID=152421 RepID=A0AAV5M770_9ROSI|nr:hypothetical protein SLEP1_g52737 [Rubroshorea leprosula]